VRGYIRRFCLRGGTGPACQAEPFVEITIEKNAISVREPLAAATSDDGTGEVEPGHE
jgi:hypothetical protein